MTITRLTKVNMRVRTLDLIITKPKASMLLCIDVRAALIMNNHSNTDTIQSINPRIPIIIHIRNATTLMYLHLSHHTTIMRSSITDLKKWELKDFHLDTKHQLKEKFLSQPTVSIQWEDHLHQRLGTILESQDQEWCLCWEPLKKKTTLTFTMGKGMMSRDNHIQIPQHTDNPHLNRAILSQP
jgi:hypothetical protein